VNSFRSRFHTQDLGRLVRKMGIEPDGGHYDSHWHVLRHIYITSPAYIRVERTNPGSGPATFGSIDSQICPEYVFEGGGKIAWLTADPKG
jgi:hypothetical protein